jgi:hypothetical protein
MMTGSGMERIDRMERIVLRLQIPDQNTTPCLRLFSIEEPVELLLPSLSLLLSLERDPGSTFSRGQIHSLDHQISFPIQCNAALFEILRQFVTTSNNSIS